MASTPRLRSGDVVAVMGNPGSPWPELVARCWDARAAVFPIDQRLPAVAAQALVGRARPTVILEGSGWTRQPAGVPTDGDIAVIVATSGAAGEPRLVEIGRAAVESAVTGSLAVLGAAPADPWLGCLPVAHIGGLLVILRSVLSGAPVLVFDHFDAALVREQCELGHVAFTSLVPTMVLRLLDAGADLAGMRGILIGGAAVDAGLRARLERAVPNAVLTYGQTQSCGGVVYNGAPLPGVNLRIGGDGEVQIAGATLMTRYRLDPPTTASSLTPDGWLRTGDSGHVTAAGLVEVDGRMDDLIITGGEKVWPHEVEVMVGEHPGVAEVAVVGRPDPEWGMRVVAYVVPSDPAHPPSRDQLRAFVAGRVARFKSPAEVVMVSALPRTALGKIRRADLPSSGG